MIQSASWLLHPQDDTVCFLSTTPAEWYSLLPVYCILRVIQSPSCLLHPQGDTVCFWLLHPQGDTVCFLSATPSGWYSLLPDYYALRVIQSASCLLHPPGDTVCFLYTHQSGTVFDHVGLWLIQHSISVFSLLVLHVLFRGWWLQSKWLTALSSAPDCSFLFVPNKETLFERNFSRWLIVKVISGVKNQRKLIGAFGVCVMCFPPQILLT